MIITYYYATGSIKVLLIHLCGCNWSNCCTSWRVCVNSCDTCPAQSCVVPRVISTGIITNQKRHHYHVFSLNSTLNITNSTSSLTTISCGSACCRSCGRGCPCSSNCACCIQMPRQVQHKPRNGAKQRLASFIFGTPAPALCPASLVLTRDRAPPP